MGIILSHVSPSKDHPLPQNLMVDPWWGTLWTHFRPLFDRQDPLFIAFSVGNHM